MDLGVDDLQLHCIIEGESEVFPVNVPGSVWHNPKFNVGHLKEKIQEKRKDDSLAGVGAHSLVLWKPKDGSPVNVKPKQTLPGRVASIKESGEELDPTDSVLTVFPEQPSLDHLHIIVRKPDAGLPDIRGKHAAPEPADGVFEHLKRAKVVTKAPSDTGRSAMYERLQQDPSEKILDDRPEPDPNIPPIPLLYDGFGHFLDIMDTRADVPGLADVDVLELRKAVDDLASKMAGYFNKEEERRDAALSCLNRIFSARRGVTIPPLYASAIGSVRTDGHNTATHGAGTMTIEFKNWTTGISSLPQIEVVGHAARLNATGMNDDARRQLYLQWSVPCVGLTIVGCDITFYAVVPIDHRFRLVTLTPTFSCIQSASDGRDRISLYSAFTAASVLQAHILQDATRLLNNPPATAIPTDARQFPAVSKLRKYPPSSDDYFTFEIRCFFPDKQPNRLLYVAEKPGAGGQFVLIKFARQYSIELHELCANSGHAPPILAFERLPGGWFAVAMEYIESGVPITHSSLLPAHRNRWMAELRALMDSFHEKDFVHGDLRDANIICKNDSVMLIDFDWGGKEGEVFYPTSNLNGDLLQGRVSGDLRITKEDDRRVLTNTLARLKDMHG